MKEIIVNKTKQAADKWLHRSRIKSLMVKQEALEKKINEEIQRNLLIEQSYCSNEDDVAYILYYENTYEMDSTIMMSIKDCMWYE